MKKSFIILVAMLIVVAVAGSSYASMITSAGKFTSGGIYGDVAVLDAHIAPEYKLQGSTDYIIVEHLFDNYPSVDDIEGAALALTLKDYDGIADEFVYAWDRVLGWNLVSGIVTGSYDYWLKLPDLAMDPAVFALGSNASDKFYLRASRMTIDSATVPEPGTLILLGSGISGLAFARRRMK